MADGTVKQVNPFSGVEVWSVPGRGNKPFGSASETTAAVVIDDAARTSACAFCADRMFETGPEKARVVRTDGVYSSHSRISPEDYTATRPLFRRVGNLFEILSIDYWRNNYNYKLSRKNLRWRDSYLSSQTGLQHVLDLIEYKLRRSGKSDEEIAGLSVDEKIAMAGRYCA